MERGAGRENKLKSQISLELGKILKFTEFKDDRWERGDAFL